ncbi:MAG: M23 family metallopeptidase [Chthoniobacterales bacterium]
MRKTLLWFIATVLVASLFAQPSPQTARTRLADGFDIPVGKPDGEGYFIQRGFRPNGHLGEDWNGARGGNTDIGDPVYAIAHGMVVFAKNARMGWGNVVIIRHAYLEGGQIRTIDSLYGHLDRITVREGQQITKGQQVGTIGTNSGMYVAHLHFEIRKNINIGVNHSSAKRDYSNYYSPNQFISSHRQLGGAGRSAVIAINTFNSNPRFEAPSDESKSRTTIAKKDGRSSSSSTAAPKSTPQRNFRVDRFGTESF